MKQLEARRLNNLFADFVVEQKNADNYDAMLLVELTGIATVGGMSHDSNGDSLLSRLETRSFDASSVLFVASHRSSLVEIYFNSTVHERGEKYRGSVVVFKCPKGKRHTFSIGRNHYATDDEVKQSVRQAFRLDRETDADLIERLYSELHYSGRIKSGDATALQAKGYKVETVQNFSHRIWVSPKYIIESKNTVEIGWDNNGTYASHPAMIRITKRKRAFPLVRLADIGAETTGYYDHHNKHTCRPEDAAALKAFAKAFARKKSRSAGVES